jgi:hypothetical protein
MGTAWESEMSSYRWLRPLRASESIGSLPNFKNCDVDKCDELLWEAVKKGDIRVLMNDEIVPKAHIGTFLVLYRRACPDQPPYTLPPDIGISYDDILAVFDRERPDNRKRGRPVTEHSGWTDDQKLAFEMHQMLAVNNPERPSSPTAAARILVEAGRVTGGGTVDSKIKRLMREFRKRYTS